MKNDKRINYSNFQGNKNWKYNKITLHVFSASIKHKSDQFTSDKHMTWWGRWYMHSVLETLQRKTAFENSFKLLHFYVP